VTKQISDQLAGCLLKLSSLALDKLVTVGAASAKIKEETMKMNGTSAIKDSHLLMDFDT